MTKYFSIIGSSLGLTGFLMILYVSISGIVNSAKWGTWNIFDTIILPIALISIIFAVIILIQTIKNSNKKFVKILKILSVIISSVCLNFMLTLERAKDYL